MGVKRFTCPCCDQKTLEEEPPGTYEICEACGWEDDELQFHDPELRGGANQMSLRECRERFGSQGATKAGRRR